MAQEEQENGLNFDLPKNRSSVIKVIGVGGGGSNAVNHMKAMGIKGVDFIVCNTDAQALEHSSVENRIQLGAHLTEGLGAGANPEVGRDAATESLEEIRDILAHNTRMVFITAGMGGGTGTGAAPVIAKLAKEMNILTVGIVTKPFRFEGKIRAKQAQEGIDSLRDNVDSLVVINNDKLREVYGNLSFRSGFAKADEVLATAAKGIAEVITYHFTTNIDLRDVRTVLENSGTAIMGSASSNGTDRAQEAVKNALDSPLLNDNHIGGAKNVLLLIVSGEGEQEITMDEMSYINEHIQDEAGGEANVILGIGIDETLDDTISVTVIATGFPSKQNDMLSGRNTPKIVHPLHEDQPIVKDVFDKSIGEVVAPKKPESVKPAVQPDLFNQEPAKAPLVHDLYEDEVETEETVAEDHFEVIDEVESTTEITPQEIKTIEVETDFEIDLAFEPEMEEEEETAAATLEIELDENLVAEETISAKETTATTVKNEIEQEENADEKEEGFSFDLDDIEGEGVDLSLEIREVEKPAEAPKEVELNAEEIDPFDQKIDDVLEKPAGEKIILEVKEEVEKPREIQPEAKLPTTEKGEEKTIKHTLEDLRELEKRLQIKKPVQENQEVNKQAESTLVEEDELLDFKTTTAPIEPSNTTQEQEEDDDLLNRPIGAASRRKILERKQRLQQYAYAFKMQKADILKKEPAYKRQGYDLGADKYSSQSNASSMSISGEGNETEIKTNNSFLHDNVD